MAKTIYKVRGGRAADLPNSNKNNHVHKDVNTKFKEENKQ